MSTNSWTPAPAGHRANRGSGLPVAGFAVPTCGAAAFGLPVTSIVPRFTDTPLGIPSSRRPSS